MLKLREFRSSDANTIAKWIKDEYTFDLWSAGKYKSFPVSGNDILEYLKKHTDCRSFTAYDEQSEDGKNDISGYFTASTLQDESSILLGSIIVDPQKRGKGYGKQMLLLATNLLFKSENINRIVIKVFLQNKPAIKCYTSCSFNVVANSAADEFYHISEKWELIEMELLKPNI